jgi:hypothetical protein
MELNFVISIFCIIIAADSLILLRHIKLANRMLKTCTVTATMF